jgi:hypothetical protein
MDVRRSGILSFVLALAAYSLAQAPQPAPCRSGSAAGVWDLPEPGLGGSADGFLRLGVQQVEYHFVATLVDVPSPCLSCVEGDVQGTLDDGSGTAPDYVVRGSYLGSFFAGAGRFRARVFRPNQTTAVGDLVGTFQDPPAGAPQVGIFRGNWLICD